MKIQLHRSPGQRNDLLVTLDRNEIHAVQLHIANPDRLAELPGLTRHRDQTKEEKEANKNCKVHVNSHLDDLGLWGPNAIRPVIAVGNRNLGNNNGFVAWQAEASRQFFHITGDPLSYPSYSCLVCDKAGALSIQKLCFDVNSRRVLSGDLDLTPTIQWASYGQQVLNSGRIVDVEEIIGEFDDIRHVLAYDPKQVNPNRDDPKKWYYKNYPDGQSIANAIYEGYPDAFAENARKALRDGVPRARYLQNALGLSEQNVFILQREGTVEEVGQWLCDAGADDGLIFDNGGSVFTWAWFVNAPLGGFLFSAPDFRPNSSAVLALILKGPCRTDLPSGSVSPTVL